MKVVLKGTLQNTIEFHSLEICTIGPFLRKNDWVEKYVQLSYLCIIEVPQNQTKLLQPVEDSLTLKQLSLVSVHCQ